MRGAVRRRPALDALQATCDEVRAAVVVGLMSTYEGLLDHNVVSPHVDAVPAKMEPARRLARSCRLPRAVAAAGAIRPRG
jgi:hypothetical protein